MSHYIITKVEEDTTEVTVYGIPYMFDDRAGKWSVWNISMYMIGTQIIADKFGIFMNLPKLLGKYNILVQTKQVLKINPAIYNLDFVSKSTVRVTKKLCEPGSSSNSTVITLVDHVSGILLAEQYFKFAFVDKVTRKAVKNPDWFLKKYSYLRGKREVPDALAKREMQIFSNRCFENRTVVRHSDQDTNLHMNASVYIKLCLDCATDASLNKKLKHFTGDITFYPVLDISIDFLGECFVGDEIVVKMWQDEKNVSVLKFAVYKVKGLIQVTYIVCHIGLNKFNSKM